MDFTPEEVKRMVADADVNGDGTIDYSEFSRVWKAHVVEVQYTPLVKKMQRVRLLLRAARAFSTFKRPTGAGSTSSLVSDEELSQGKASAAPSDVMGDSGVFSFTEAEGLKVKTGEASSKGDTTGVSSSFSPRNVLNRGVNIDSVEMSAQSSGTFDDCETDTMSASAGKRRRIE